MVEFEEFIEEGVIARPVCEVRGCDAWLAAQYEYFLVYEGYKGLGTWRTWPCAGICTGFERGKTK